MVGHRFRHTGRKTPPRQVVWWLDADVVGLQTRHRWTLCGDCGYTGDISTGTPFINFKMVNYDDHEDFNKARTPEEESYQFANAREAVYDKARADFSGGTKDGIVTIGIGALMFLLFLVVT